LSWSHGAFIRATTFQLSTGRGSMRPISTNRRSGPKSQPQVTRWYRGADVPVAAIRQFARQAASAMRWAAEVRDASRVLLGLGPACQPRKRP
jgi:hypothetical protein